ncbi:MAG: hypothetical protein ACREO4_06395 [Lysobacter sp.]
MSAPTSIAPNGVALNLGKDAEPTSLGASPFPHDLGHWIHGKRLRVCLTPREYGAISVYIAVPAHALPHPARYGVHVNSDHQAVEQFLPGELEVDVATNTLRGSRAGCPTYCPAYRVGFSLELEPDMTADVALAVRHCNTLARLMASQQEP